MNLLALAGGVGGAKLAHGLAQILPPENLTVIVNTGDDFEHLGLRISPDLDTVCYTLAGLANPDTGWGRADETWNAMANLKRLGAPDWFNLGDRDLATHLERTRRLNAGQTLSQVTRDFCAAWGVKHTVLPMSDDPVRTMVDTDEGELPFQEYFVHRHCEPRVKSFRFEGLSTASPAAGVREAVESADAIIICPSNPWVSIDPILAVLHLSSFISRLSVIAVSPIIAGKTVKGPAAKMFAELGIEPSALAVADHYENLLTGIVVDSLDSELAKQIRIPTLVTNTIMQTVEDRARLAHETLQFIGSLP
ncbi:MAG: 2-phospho-L-lactate transferase [Anaerolineales bacterium]|nr:2-phospho-L-lactate transferase [Anaerolineales bacterium]